ncbi:MAG: hypothetical protein D6719_09600 [Candidatus Dadabacteria bacterium]|nr:MAG: hypothetical protein D6719_09600 [Candidatus Dadabacteria bacterium]
MLTDRDFAENNGLLSKNVHCCVESVQKLPENTVMMSVLKTFETGLQRRSLVPDISGYASPLWFLSETERNVFLWRSGYSLRNQNDFEFWINPFDLIKKRLRQLEINSSGNPFTGPLWEDAAAQDDFSERERLYLKLIEEQLKKAINHLHALSKVGSLLIRERTRKEQAVIVLPGKFRIRRVEAQP